MATSQRRIEANRANARKSTGPRTERGKRRSKFNALAHGLTARAALLPGDDPEDYRRFVRRVLDELDPRGAIQEELAGEIANNSWKLRRVPLAEAILLERTHGARAEEPADVIVNMILDKGYKSDPGSPLWLLVRYTREAERSRATAMRMFLSLRKASEKREDELSERLEAVTQEEGEAEEGELEEEPDCEAPEEEPVPDESPAEESAPEEDSAPENALPLRNEPIVTMEATAAQAEPVQDNAAASPAPAAQNGTPSEPNSEAVTGRATGPRQQPAIADESMGGEDSRPP